MLGSAPYLTRSFIASTSVPYAARQNAVEPVTFDRPQLPLTAAAVNHCTRDGPSRAHQDPRRLRAAPS
jgi:hypothetical protein